MQQPALQTRSSVLRSSRDLNNSGTVAIGDSLLSTINYSIVLSAGDTQTWGPFSCSCYPFLEVWVMGSSTNQKVGVEIVNA